MNNDIAIEIKHLNKGFKLPHEKQTTLKGLVINFNKRGFERQRVLKDLSFTVSRGEFLGILGRNGSGKSTLLKTMSGIYSPDSGTLNINGKLTPFIELGVGFNPELSGRDNVYLNGALLGFSRSEINAIYTDIVAFAELERFMDQKLKNYSSGMQVRLAFSIAIRANTDILVLDEVLAVGDEAFQRKCYDYFNELKANGKTVILVTHDMGAVQRFCTRAIVLHDGKVLFDGNTESATDVYRDLNLKSTEVTLEKANAKRQSLIKKRKDTSLFGITTHGTDHQQKTSFIPHEQITIRTTLNLKHVTKPAIQIWFNNPGGVPLDRFYLSYDDLKKQNVTLDKDFSLDWYVEGIFNDGRYLITYQVDDEDKKRVSEIVSDACEFIITGWEATQVLIHPPQDFKINQ